MRRVIVIAVAGASLAGCSSLSLDAFKPTPPTVQVQLESVPQGADARTSLGPGCKTPCSVDRPQSGGRGAPAGRPTAEGGAENAEAEKAKTPEGHGRGASCRIGIPRAGTGTAAARAHPLIACTAPAAGS